MRRVGVVVVICLAAIARTAVAQYARAESTFPLSSWDARANGFASAGTALAGSSQLRLNPAAIAGHQGIALTLRETATGARDYEAVFMQRVGSAALALQMRRRDWGELGEGLGLTGLTASENILGLSAAARSGALQIGLTAEALNADYLSSRFNGWAFDAGVQWIRPRYGVGASLVHMGRGFEGGSSSAPLPTRARTGLAWKVWSPTPSDESGVTLLADAEVSTQHSSPLATYVGVGVEQHVALLKVSARAGGSYARNRINDQEFAYGLGAGLSLGKVELALSYLPTALGSGVAITLGINW